jgi:PAS domain S-box-containing protein
MPAVLWSMDRDLRFTLSLGAGLAALGLRPNQMVGSSLQEFAGTDDPHAPMIAAHRRALAGESVSFRIEWSGRWFEAHVEPYHDAEGRTAGLLGVALDVTERRRAEDELQRTLAMLQSTLDSTEDGILVLDPAGRVSTCNRRFVEMWGLAPHELASRDAERWIAAALEKVDDPREFLEGVRQLEANRDSVDRSRVRLRDGRVFERLTMPQRIDGRVVGHVLSFREVAPDAGGSG